MDFVVILGTAVVGDLIWAKVIDPWLDKRKTTEVFVRPARNKQFIDQPQSEVPPQG